MSSEVPQEIRICFIGESFVNGTGDPECLGWTGRICVEVNKKGFDITYYNLGVRRETSTELRKRWLNEVSYRLPQEYDGRVVFGFGTNDTTIEDGETRVMQADSISNTREILTEAKQLYPVLMVSPLPIDDKEQNRRTAKLSEEFALVCAELDIPYLDGFSTLEKSQVWMDEVRNNDGAHPRSAGYQELADIVQNWEAWKIWF
ncbi:MAG: GDSL-type esterase/lipase family protein [Cyanobacteria bacterium P01_A01_bin.45]